MPSSESTIRSVRLTTTARSTAGPRNGRSAPLRSARRRTPSSTSCGGDGNRRSRGLPEVVRIAKIPHPVVLGLQGRLVRPRAAGGRPIGVRRADEARFRPRHGCDHRTRDVPPPRKPVGRPPVQSCRAPVRWRHLTRAGRRGLFRLGKRRRSMPGKQRLRPHGFWKAHFHACPARRSDSSRRALIGYARASLGTLGGPAGAGAARAAALCRD